ncbi:hypothetical protein D3C73_586610 [compost metagenome]
MHDRIHAFKQFRRKVTDIAEDLFVEHTLGKFIRQRQALGEITGIEPDKLRVRPDRSKMCCHDRADITHISGDQDTHIRTASILWLWLSKER